MCGQDKRRPASRRYPLAERPAADQALRRAAEDALRGKDTQSSADIEEMWPEAVRQMVHELRVHQIELEMQNEELRRLQVELDTTRARYFDIYDLAPVGYCTLSEQGLILEANLTAATLLGVARGALASQRISRFILKADQDIFYLHRKQLLATGQRQACDLRMVMHDGTPLWAHLESVVVQCGDGVRALRTVIGDITGRKEAEARIQDLAFFDSLTHLPNRTLLRDHLTQTMKAGHRTGAFGALLFLDLDHFKTLNDTQGHHQGDLLLQAVARRLAASVRESDTVARLGGDEFVVIMGNLNRKMEEAARQTEVVGEKILAALSQPYRLAEVDHHSTASIGATLFRGLETSVDDLLRQADLAMYQAKAAGGNALHFFDPAMQAVVFGHAALEAGLRRAIQEHRFVLHYQAQVTADGRVTGSEVLVRWQHPEDGMLAPAKFIPLAEETHLIVPLGDWVLETACMQLTEWATRPDMAHLTVAVNVSAQQFREADFVDKLLAILTRTGADPNRLKLELTESLLVDHAEDSIEKMVALRARGVGFSLDDFGTGYSSLSCLKHLPLDQLKIDQSFVRDVLSDPTDAAIAMAVVALAHSRALGVIAEGVETDAQRDFLESSGCHVYQGYFFSRPLPVGDFEAFVRRG
jgi:diguanylate cyclase (GGDEF)-like protein/PAS domain S-box-containing protein